MHTELENYIHASQLAASARKIDVLDFIFDSSSADLASHAIILVCPIQFNY